MPLVTELKHHILITSFLIMATLIMATLVEAHSKPQFFKVLLPTSLQKLLIPPEFNKHIIQDELKKATILSPFTKTSWYIKVQKDENCFYFEEGWHDFVEAHSLKIGYFITFRYEGYEIFTFTAFDLTACQVDFTDGHMNRKHKKSKIYDKKCRMSKDASKDIEIEEEEEEDASKDIEIEEEEEEESLGNQAILRDKNAYSESPNSVERTLSHYNIKSAQLEIPKIFCDSNDIRVGNLKIVVLKDSQGMQWNVSVSRCSYGGFRLGKGLRDFLEENNLEEGDRCVFELVKSNDKVLIFKVQILKNCRQLQIQKLEQNCRESASKCIDRKELNSLRKQMTLQDKNACVEKPNCLERTVNRNHLRNWQMDFPRSFYELNELTAVDCVLLKDPRGREWNVSVGGRCGGQFRLGKGFRDFAIANNLKIGDRCVFEHVKSKEEAVIFKVQMLN